MSLEEQDILRRITELEKVHTRYSGPAGKPGKDAPPPKILVGTVTSGEQADAKIRTADGTFFLDLCLPRGADGVDGKDGVSNIHGPAGRAGRDGVDGHVVIGQVVGGSSAVAAIHVADDVQIIDLCVPRGAVGPQGPRGEVGPAGTPGTPGRDGIDGKDSTVPGPQGTPGRDGRDGKDGASDVPGPRGERGESGPQGIAGPVGPQGPPGPPGPQGLRGPVGKPGDISAAVAQAEAEARAVVREELAKVYQRLERLERAK